jgi:hypothetical protein
MMTMKVLKRGERCRLDAYGLGTTTILTLRCEGEPEINVAGVQAMDMRAEMYTIEHTWPEYDADQVLEELMRRTRR